MRNFTYALLGLGTLFILLATSGAQPPERGRGPDRDGPPPPPRGPLFEALDKDHDGELSADEIQSASESLKKLDKNGDGKLSGDEIRPQGPPRRSPGGPDGAGPGDRGRAPERGDADRGEPGAEKRVGRTGHVDQAVQVLSAADPIVPADARMRAVVPIGPAPVAVRVRIPNVVPTAAARKDADRDRRMSVVTAQCPVD